MGARGPVPKRSNERRRRNKESEVETVQPLTDEVEVPPANPAWHAIAKGWYESLQTSGQSRFYEPSDWWAAQYVADAMSRNLKQKAKFSSVLFAAVMSGMTDLLTTEAARRRVRMEIERNGNEGAEEPAGVVAIDDYRKRLNG